MKIDLTTEAPLAERLRPSAIEEFIGQKHLRGKLTAMASGGRLQSMLLFGPPGCGKSTIAIV